MRYLNFFGIIFILAVIASFDVPPEISHEPAKKTLAYFKLQSIDFAQSTEKLYKCIKSIDPANPNSVQPAISALKKCRLLYKKISFFLDYFFPQAGKLYNGPAKLEVEEPFLETSPAQSLQQIESILFGLHPEQKKLALKNLAMVISESANDLPALYYRFNASEAQFMESIHLELIRIMTLYIAGYDAPELKTGIQESCQALISMKTVFDFYSPADAFKKAQTDQAFEKAIRFTRSGDFDTFNRLIFLTGYAIPLEEQLGHFIKKNRLQIRTVPNLDYNARNFFQGEVIIANPPPSPDMIALGKTLFFEKALSGNKNRSCASCHQPDKYFTDQLTVNRAINNDANLRRNTPGLSYAGYQSTQFWDGRAGSLTEQIKDVLTSKEEMNASFSAIEKKLNTDSFYRKAFCNAFDSVQSDSITIQKIQTALTGYLQTLAPMNSAFDRYMAGDQKALSTKQKQGFNLFMGKAQCGTCHFAPLFNGTTPPFFNRSEFEVLGTPASENFKKKTLDEDFGRYEFYPVNEYKRAFKTPTLRNIAHTHPYMHNGSFKSLFKVVDFYNRGGGTGIGLDVPSQTLSAKPLHLSKTEIHSIVAFLQALTDSDVH